MGKKSGARRYIPVLMLALMLITGCATHLSSHLWPNPPPDGYATLLMYRDHGQKTKETFFIDDVAAFKLHAGSYSWVYVRAGQHTLRTKWRLLFSGLNSNGKVTLEPGKNYYLKQISWVGGMYPIVTINVGIRGVSERIANLETTNCDYIKPLILKIDSQLNSITNTNRAP